MIKSSKLDQNFDKSFCRHETFLASLGHIGNHNKEDILIGLIVLLVSGLIVFEYGALATVGYLNSGSSYAYGKAWNGNTCRFHLFG